MLYSYLLTILRRRKKFCRFILLINIYVLLFILIKNNIDDKNVPLPHRNIVKNLIDDRLRSHARFFDESSLPCDTTDTWTVESKQHFDRIAQVLTQLRQQTIPLYSENHFNGQGIVLTVSISQISQCKINLKMMEYVETRLPVQIWYSPSELSDDTVNELLHSAPKLQLSACSFTIAQCRTINLTWNLNSTYVFPPSVKRGTSYFPTVPAAILSATFTEVLFLDVDSYLVRDPEYLFQFDPMYHQFGALFFPDALPKEQPLAIWKALNMTCGRDEFEFENGAILVNKRRVWNALYMAKLINDQYELLHKLFPADHKDTFRFAFRFLHVKYYLVGRPCSTGHYDGTYFCGFTTCKTDSLGQYIFINHLNLRNYVNAGYSSYHLGYTRLALGDPYNHSFYMQYCPFRDAKPCLIIDTEVNELKSINKCRNRPINPNEIDNHAYSFNEPIRTEYLPNGQMLMSETNNLMSGFVGSLFHYRRQVYDN